MLHLVYNNNIESEGDYMTRGDYIKSLREEKRLSQRKLAALADVSNTTVSRIESDATTPDLETLEKIANVLDINPSILMDETFKEPTSTTSESAASLSSKQEKDIAKQLEKTMELIDKQEGIMFDGEPLDDLTKQLLKESLENSMRMAKITNKKYTPKKYR